MRSYMPKYSLEDYRKFGKAGAEKRWSKRHDMLVEVSKMVDKETLNWIQSKWDTRQIETLLDAWKRN